MIARAWPSSPTSNTAGADVYKRQSFDLGLEMMMRSLREEIDGRRQP